MDECVAVAVAEAVAVAVTEAVAEADQSIHDQSIHDPPIQKQKQKQMDNQSKLDNQFSKSKKPFSESKKPCSPPFQIKNDLRWLSMKNRLFKERSRKSVYSNVLVTVL